MKAICCPYCQGRNPIINSEASEVNGVVNMKNCFAPSLRYGHGENPERHRCMFCKTVFLFDRTGETYPLPSNPLPDVNAFRRAASAIMPKSRQRQLHTLLERNTEGMLTDNGRKKLNLLVEEYEEGTLVKSRALVQLARSEAERRSSFSQMEKAK